MFTSRTKLLDVLGRDVETVDMFLVGQFDTDMVRPIVVRLWSIWDRRLLVNGAFKLKNYDHNLYIRPDKPLKARRKHQLNGLKACSVPDDKHVVVDNGGFVC